MPIDFFQKLIVVVKVFPIFFESLGFDNRTPQNDKERLDMLSDIRVRLIRQKLGFFDLHLTSQSPEITGIALHFLETF